MKASCLLLEPCGFWLRWLHCEHLVGIRQEPILERKGTKTSKLKKIKLHIIKHQRATNQHAADDFRAAFPCCVE